MTEQPPTDPSVHDRPTEPPEQPKAQVSRMWRVFRLANDGTRRGAWTCLANDRRDAAERYLLEVAERTNAILPGHLELLLVEPLTRRGEALPVTVRVLMDDGFDIRVTSVEGAFQAEVDALVVAAMQLVHRARRVAITSHRPTGWPVQSPVTVDFASALVDVDQADDRVKAALVRLERAVDAARHAAKGQAS
ncbi:MAG: hypothetical protein AAGH15_25850 [Myxococcota bacterium]